MGTPKSFQQRFCDAADAANISATFGVKADYNRDGGFTINLTFNDVSPDHIDLMGFLEGRINRVSNTFERHGFPRLDDRTMWRHGEPRAEDEGGTRLVFDLEMGFALSAVFAPDAGEPPPDYLDKAIAFHTLLSVVEDFLGEDARESMTPDVVAAITERVASMPILGGYLYNARKGPDQAIMDAAEWMTGKLSDELKWRIIEVFRQHQPGY